MATTGAVVLLGKYAIPLFHRREFPKQTLGEDHADP